MADHGVSPEPAARPERIVAVSGELDMATVESFVDRATAEVVGGPATLTIDFAGVEFCDSAGINGLVRMRKLCDGAGWGFRMINLRPHIRRVLVDLTGLGEFLGVPAEPAS